MDISNVPDEFKVMVIKMLTEWGKKIDDVSENFNKETENNKRTSHLKHTITEVKNTTEAINSRIEVTEEQISKWEDKVVESVRTEEQREKEFLKVLRSL